MADPLTLSIGIIAIVSSSVSVINSLQDVTRRLKDSEPGLERQVSEIKVLLAVLDECQIVFSSGMQIPLSVEGAMSTCSIRHQELIALFEQVVRYRGESRTTFSRMARGAKILAREREMRSAYNAFRDSVLLLRDLSSEVRMNQQLLNMSAGIAQLMAEYSEDITDDVGHQTYDQSHKDETQVAGLSAEASPDHTQTDESDSHQRPRRHNNAIMKEFAKLIKSNFTRDATVVVDTATEPGPPRLKYLPVRAKMDTGCDENLVSLDLLLDAGINQELLEPIQDEYRVEFGGVEGFKFAPDFEVNLAWYHGQEMKIRRSKFYVVKGAPFDILIGSKRFVQDLRSPALFLASRRKTKAELQTERANHERQLTEGRELELRQLQEGLSAREAQQRQRELSVTTGAATVRTDSIPLALEQNSSKLP